MAQRAQYLRKALANFNMCCVAGNTLGEVTVHHPGFTYSDTSSISAYPSVWNLQRYVEGVRFFAHHVPPKDSQTTFLEYDQLTADRFTFIASTEFHISADMYDYDQPKAPIEACVKLNHVGTASLSSTCDLSVDGKHFLSNTNCVISVDVQSRTPMTLPEWWVNKYKSLAATDVAFRVIRKPHPDGCPQGTTLVRWSDTDFYKHSNWASYVKYCLDVANVLSIEEKFEKVKPSTVRNNAVKTASLAFVGESEMGDSLDVFAWESGDKQLEFDVMKDDKPVCYCKVEYYDPAQLPNAKFFNSSL